MKKYDYIIIALLLILSFVPYVIGFVPDGTSKTVFAEVYMDNKLVDSIDISDISNLNKEHTYHGANGHNTILISNSGISVKTADCPDQICVKSKPIKKSNRVIACIPNDFFIKIVSKSNSSNQNDDVDFISE